MAGREWFALNRHGEISGCHIFVLSPCGLRLLNELRDAVQRGAIATVALYRQVEAIRLGEHSTQA